RNERLAARIRLQGALEIDPANAEAHLYLGEVYRAEGQRTKAEEHYALAKDLDPDSAEAAIALARLQTLRAGAATAAAEALLDAKDVETKARTATRLVSVLDGAWCWNAGGVQGTSVISG